jgi:MinD superfamily P-loop ATPase
MQEIAVISGKGGTGKTSLTAALAALVPHKIMVDCDVDAADLHLILKPSVAETYEFRSGESAVIDARACSHCGLCRDVCRFGAVSPDFHILDYSCEGCGFCEKVCPSGAITLRENLAGQWFVSETRFGGLVHARLGIAAENSGKLVAVVRRKAREIALSRNLDYIISDGPPGIGCPVISAISGIDLALLVTEPTLSGIHDLQRVLEVCRHFNVPARVCINKYDINPANTAKLEDFCRDQNVGVAARLPYDDSVTQAMTRGLSLPEYSQGTLVREIEALWQALSSALSN